MSSKKKNRNSSGENTAPVVQSAQTQPAATPQQQQSTQTQPQQQRPPRNQSPSYRPPRNIAPTVRPTPWQKQAKQLLKNRLVQLAIVLIIAALPSLYFYHTSKQAEQKASAPGSANLQTTAEVVKRVSRHILLPSGEQPTVATVSDASKVRGQAFFANAASGDKVLIYAQAKKAYLYRPGIDRIIEVAPLAPNGTTK